MQNGLWIHKSWWQHVLCLKINKFFLHRQFILTDVSFIAEVHEESWKIDLMLPDKLWFEPKKTPTKIKLMRNSFSVNAKANLLFSLSYFSELMFFLFTLFLVSHFFSSLRQCFFAVNLRYESNFLLKKKKKDCTRVNKYEFYKFCSYQILQSYCAHQGLLSRRQLTRIESAQKIIRERVKDWLQSQRNKMYQ